MIVVPIVISTLIVGIAGVGNTKQLGSLGFKTILYFEIITTIAIIVGISFANIFQPECWYRYVAINASRYFSI